MTHPATRRAQAGADFLDLHLPGWENTIDLRQLDLSLCGTCVLGQLYDDFWSALEFIGISETAAEALGFMDIDDSFKDEDYDPDQYLTTLTHAWKREIKKRRVQ